MAQDANHPVVRSFAQANPVGPGQDDVPALLRRVADTIEELGDLEVMDLVLHVEVDGGDHAYRPSLSVYYAPDDEPSPLRLVQDPD